MPTDAQVFFEEQKRASQYKVKLLGDYAEPFFYKLGSRYKRVWIADGFAGPGIYEGDQPGSPLATAKVAAKVAAGSHSSELRIINVERDRELFARLEQNLAPYGHLTINLGGRFADRLPDILQIIGNDPVLFFIDPFGMTGSDIRLIDQILARKPRTVTELLINFSFRGFQRMAGNLTERRRSRARQQAAETKISELDAKLGSLLWRSIWQNEELGSVEKCERAAELFASALRARGIDHVHPIRMRDEYTGPTRYELLFATRSSHGVYLMSDLVCRYERSLPGADAGDQLSLLGSSGKRAERPTLAELREKIHTLGLALGRASPIKLQRLLAPSHFSFFTLPDYDECIRQLVRAGGISRESARGIKPREQLRFVPIPGGEPRSQLIDAKTLIELDGALPAPRLAIGGLG